MTAEPEIVTLKNGGKIPEPLVSTTMIALRHLEAANPVALIELAAACRDKAHVMFGRTGSAVMELSLIKSQSFDGTVAVFDSVRDVVLSAVTGEDFGIVLGSPMAGES